MVSFIWSNTWKHTVPPSLRRPLSVLVHRILHTTRFILFKLLLAAEQGLALPEHLSDLVGLPTASFCFLCVEIVNGDEPDMLPDSRNCMVEILVYLSELSASYRWNIVNTVGSDFRTYIPHSSIALSILDDTLSNSKLDEQEREVWKKCAMLYWRELCKQAGRGIAEILISSAVIGPVGDWIFSEKSAAAETGT